MRPTLLPLLDALGFAAKVASERLGVASATKMCRSVMIKGLEAMVDRELHRRARLRRRGRGAGVAEGDLSRHRLGEAGRLLLPARDPARPAPQPRKCARSAETVREIGLDAVVGGGHGGAPGLDRRPGRCRRCSASRGTPGSRAAPTGASMPTACSRSPAATDGRSLHMTRRLTKTPGWLDWYANPSQAAFARAARRGRRALPRVRSGRRVSVRARAQVHAVRCARRSSCSRCATSSASRATSSCRRPATAPTTARWSTRSSIRTARRAASRPSGADVTDDELQAMHAAGVRGVRFNFVKRLVDFTPKRRADRDRRAASPRSAGTSSIYFEAQDLPELWDFFTALPTDRRRRPHGPARRRPSRSTARSSSCS